jgi:hypothetical protein
MPALNFGPHQGRARNAHLCVHLLQSLSVTLCATSLNIKKFYILPTEYLYVLYVSQKKTLKLSLYNPPTDFITEEASVYSAVRPGSLNGLRVVLKWLIHTYLRTISCLYDFLITDALSAAFCCRRVRKIAKSDC